MSPSWISSSSAGQSPRTDIFGHWTVSSTWASVLTAYWLRETRLARDDEDIPASLVFLPGLSAPILVPHAAVAVTQGRWRNSSKSPMRWISPLPDGKAHPPYPDYPCER